MPWRSSRTTPSWSGPLVAHEPPLASLLPDWRDSECFRVTEAIHDTYMPRDGFGAGMAKFIAIVSHKGEFPAGFGRSAGLPTRPMFGMPATDDGSRERRPAARRTSSRTTHYEPDFDALRAASTRIVVAVGVESEGEMARPRGGEGRRPTAGHGSGDVPERPWRLHGWRVRPARRRARGVRSEAPRGPYSVLT